MTGGSTTPGSSAKDAQRLRGERAGQGAEGGVCQDPADARTRCRRCRIAGIAAARPCRGAGAGAAGVEARLATLFCWRQRRPHRVACAQRVSTGATRLPAMALGAARRADAALKATGASVQLTASLNDTQQHPGELVRWATRAKAQAWQQGCGLAVSASRLIRVDLSVNLSAALGDGPLAVCHPQRRVLSQLPSAKGRAIVA